MSSVVISENLNPDVISMYFAGSDITQCLSAMNGLEDVEKKQGAPVDRQLVARKGAKSRRRVIGRNHSFRVAAEGGCHQDCHL